MSTTIAGNITADPEVRFTATGTAVCNFTVASTPRRYDKDTDTWTDGDTLFLRCTAWAAQAENIVEQLAKGARVMVTGDLEQHQYTDAEGNERTSIELAVEEIGSSLRFATKPGNTKAPAGTRGSKPSTGQRSSAGRAPARSAR